MQEIYDFLTNIKKEHGFIGILIVIIIVLIQDPDKILKIKSIIFSGVSSVFKVGNKAYIGSTISYKLNDFFNNDNINHIFNSTKLRFKVKWVIKSDDPTLSENGTIILNLTNNHDQTKNILKATQVSLPLIVCPSIRKSIDIEYQNGIDLTLMKKMTDQLGQHAYPIFEKYFLAPSLDNKAELHELYTKLIKIDNYGIFVPIFIEELNILSSIFYTEGITTDISEDIKDFIEYLLTIANRNLGEEIQLLYIRKHFKIGFLLVAKKLTAESMGVKPYLERIKNDFRKGCEKVYVIGFKSNELFFRDLEKILKKDQRYKITSITDYSKRKFKKNDISLLSIKNNEELSDNSFLELINYNNINVGDTIECISLEVLRDVAIFDVNGISGFVYQKECSWSHIVECPQVFKQNNKYNLIVKDIDNINERLLLSNRHAEQNPNLLSDYPKLNTTIRVKIIYEFKTSFLAQFSDKIEVIIPKKELSWSSFVEYEKFKNLETDVIVYSLQPDSTILGSIKRNISNPWSSILKQYPRNSELTAEIVNINERGVNFLLPNGLIAFSSNEKVSQSQTEQKIIIGNICTIRIEKIFTKLQKIYVVLIG